MMENQTHLAGTIVLGHLFFRKKKTDSIFSSDRDGSSGREPWTGNLLSQLKVKCVMSSQAAVTQVWCGVVCESVCV